MNATIETILAAQQRSVDRGLAFEIFEGVCLATGRDFNSEPFRRYCSDVATFEQATLIVAARGYKWRKLSEVKA